MRKQFVAALAVLVLAGCAAEPVMPARRTYSDPHCAAVARDRVMDAQANNIDPALDPRIFGDTYATCMRDTHPAAPP